MERDLMTRLRTAALAVLATTALVGCGGDNPSNPGTNLNLSIVSGDGQVGAVGIPLPAPLIVLVENASGNPANGEQVTWALASAAGPNSSLSASSTTSETDGRTSNTFTLGDAVGVYQVRASVPGSSVTFTVEATDEGALTVVSGSGQVGTVGAQAGRALVVKALGTGGAGVAGVEVAFEVTQSAGAGATVDPAVATTGANGEASTLLTFGDANGSVTVGASANGSSVNFSGYACGGDASAGSLDLQPGEDAVISGAGVACVQLPAHAAGAEYEVAVTPLPQALGFNDMTLAVAGAAAASPAPAVAPPTGSLAARGSFALADEGYGADWRARQYEWDMQLREMERPLRPHIQANAVRGSGFGLAAAAPLEGDILDFGFSCITPSQFPNAPSDITAQVVKVSTNAVILEDTLSRGSFTPAEYDAIATNFDDVIIGTETQYFGDLLDVPGDIAPGQIVILYSQGVNQLTENYTDGFIAGFFCPQDLGFAGGNDAKMFYLLVPDPGGDYTPDGGDGLSKDQVLRITDNTVAHELQHLINSQKVPFPGMEVWLNEGLSHLAEEVVGHAASGLGPGTELGPAELLSGPVLDVFLKYYRDNFINLGQYLLAPGDTAALLNSQDPLGQNTFRMRGTAWSFVRYLLDRTGAPASEWQKTRQLLTDGDASVDSRESITNVFGVPFNELAADWAAMLNIEDRDDLGGPPRPTLTLTSYQLRAMYEASSTFGGQYPLMPADRLLNLSSTIDMDLFTGTTSYVTLRATAASGGTGLRLMEAGSGGDLAGAITPYVVITRTK
jgi:hypothetical protein